MLQFVEVLSSIRISEYSKYWMLKFHFSTRNAFDQHNLWEQALQGRSAASQLNLQGHNMWNRGILQTLNVGVVVRRRGRGCRNEHIWCKNNLDGGQDFRGWCTAAFWLFFFLSFFFKLLQLLRLSKNCAFIQNVYFLVKQFM